ncbi:MAG: hypothetical protein KF689_03840 [Gemmatimonadaceae bacterium]|nr:hypothetical protein [Gemmatimonadaceae bacterium]MCW5825687.1 hypothetical protein [Gemmatimonadaceae bacterium]
MHRLLSLALLVALAACGGTPSVEYDGPYRAEVRRAIPQLEKATGLKFTSSPRLEERDRDEVREFLERQFAEQLSPLELAGIETAYKRFGMIPDTMDLRAFLLDLLTEQVAGYYDPETRVLYVVKGGSPDIIGVTISHELVHALQHMHFPLDTTRALKGDNDRQVALQAMVEGQAVYEQMTMMLGGSDFGLRLPGGWDQVREVIRSEQASMPKFASAPTVLQETLLFPYIAGAEFIRQFKRARPGQVPYAPPPSSTEQILHPEKYLDSLPDLPTRVTLGPPRGASLLHEDNFGEFETRLFLYEHLRDVGGSAAGAAGWDGDRYQVVQVAGGTGVVWITVWDDAVEAADFRDRMERMVERRYGAARGSGGAGPQRNWTLRGRRLLLEQAELQGRAVVFWEDLPAAARTPVLDRTRVRLEEP